MKLYLLKLLAKRLAEFSHISYIARTDDNLIRIEFDRKLNYYFDLARGKSSCYPSEEHPLRRTYHAPFDKTLQKLFTRANIDSVAVSEQDRILRIEASTHSSYKKSRAVLQLEFTGRNTNAIILDDKEVVIEALRHIDSSVSFREVKPGRVLQPLPSHVIREKTESISDIDAYLAEMQRQRQDERLQNMRQQLTRNVEEKIQRFEQLIAGLEDENDLHVRSTTYREEGNLILAHLHTIPPYQKTVELTDFDGQQRTITMPKKARDAKEASRMLFDHAKKAAQKAKNLHIERQNLQDRKEFYQKMLQIVTKSQNIQQLAPLFQKGESRKKERGKKKEYESFFVEGFKVSIGKNERENSLLLKDAKADDIWLHAKDIPSSHVIIHCGKQKTPPSVIAVAARLCVEFSGLAEGSYLVDYTYRKFVRIKEGAKVNYVNYQTLTITKGVRDGCESSR